MVIRFVTLSEEEHLLVDRLEKESPNHIARLRCNLLKLSGKKLSMMAISRLTDVKSQRIADFFSAWEKAPGLEEKRKTLFIKRGAGQRQNWPQRKTCFPSC